MNASSLTDDPEMQRMLAQQELFQNIKRIQGICWDKCMQDGVDSSLTGKQESCLGNCAERFVDAVVVATSRFNQRISGGH